MMDSNDSVLIDYGTGFFVERDIVKASSFCDRKVSMLKENMDKVANMIKQKRKLFDQISLEIQRKMVGGGGKGEITVQEQRQVL